MISRTCPVSSPTAVRIRTVLANGFVLLLLFLCACSPPSAQSDAAIQPAPDEADEAPSVAEPAVSQLQQLLQRLGEPSMEDNCEADVTTYRLVRLDFQQHASAVRVFSGPDDRGYRSVFSPQPEEAISRDSWIDERTWNSIESEFRIRDFWQLDQSDFGRGTRRGVMYLEGCKDGMYHRLEGEPGTNWLSSIESRLSRTGQLDWLAGGRREYN